MARCPQPVKRGLTLGLDITTTELILGTSQEQPPPPKKRKIYWTLLLKYSSVDYTY